MHLEELQNTDIRCRKNETHLWKIHGEIFFTMNKGKGLINVFTSYMQHYNLLYDS